MYVSTSVYRQFGLYYTHTTVYVVFYTYYTTYVILSLFLAYLPDVALIPMLNYHITIYTCDYTEMTLYAAIRELMSLIDATLSDNILYTFPCL